LHVIERGVVVIGGGVVGTAVTLSLARRGHKPLLLERSSVAAGVSGASLAAIGRHLVGPVDELPLVLESTERWKAVADELLATTGIDIEFDVSGQLRLIEESGDGRADEENLQTVTRLVEGEREHGLSVEMLTPAAVKRLVPVMATDRLAGASWCPSDAKLNALLACHALAMASEHAGAELRVGYPVLELSDDRPWKLRIPQGTVRADVVVIAAGPWTGQLLSALEPSLASALVPKKAQCCATERIPPMIDPIIASVSLGLDPGYTQLHQTRHGEILFNTVVDTSDPGLDTGDLPRHVDAPFLLESSKRLLELFPSLADTRLLRSWAACEAWTPDDKFCIGEINGRGGLFLAAGDNGTGFLRAPLIAHLITQLIEGEQPAHDLTRFSPNRFNQQATADERVAVGS
jgi:sarcosine oxidase subunit beta